MNHTPVVVAIINMNARHAEEVVQNDESVYEILGEEHDIAQVVRAVKEAGRARAVR